MKMHDLFYLFTGLIIPTYNIANWLGHSFNGYFRKKLIKTEREAIIYTHAKLRSLKMGHEHKSAHICVDGECYKI